VLPIMKTYTSYCFLLLTLLLACTNQPVASQKAPNDNPTTVSTVPAGSPATSTVQAEKPAPALKIGAEQLNLYLPDLQGKRVALVVNNTSLVGKTHLVDTLLKLKVDIKKIFAPEHGFRGEAANGEQVANGVDTRTNLLIVSLYGKNKKPTPEQLADVDVLIFDIQDVGARFFTYISTMHYLMEACAENGKTLIVLDRPNPNGDYVDGPIMQKQFTSFIGMHPIPIVHGLTVGELALMINGEKWLEGGKQCQLKVIRNANYTHQTPYKVSVRPSPNLPNNLAIRLYPSICLFEGTNISLGRGTDLPFLVIGAPDPVYGTYQFTPRSRQESKYPPLENKLCYGINLSTDSTGLPEKKFTLSYLLDFYQKAPDKTKFFLTNNFFEKLVGTETLRKQIQSGMTEAQIKATWQTDLLAYRQLRSRYLLYQE
jgi:uncharacterized protein YbbC (DUF1343 family)